MNKSRLEAFSDGVLAVIITVMVLELRVPQGESLESLRPLFSVFVSYVLSFIFVAIYWNNHHHLFQAVQKVNGGILWANLHLLFWLSLIPFLTGWMGQNAFSAWPVALYGVDLLFAGIAYYILAHALISHQGKNSELARAIGDDWKGKASVVFYLAAIPVAFRHPWISYGCYIGVALMWLVPDRRIERTLNRREA